jgi:hypothetical protein
MKKIEGGIISQSIHPSNTHPSTQEYFDVNTSNAVPDLYVLSDSGTQTLLGT